ncbi:cytochrome c biogenesis protein ResB [Aquimarina agarilytica]|uniref:cytochrome c biogenesis protein ResB n=1 Tax=Aquimarina agarilytica TaxID=1087449 RepID=UPI00058C8B1F|nr:cytochrome c biogenesis protein ResB [Aquimarina agarilytica]
MRLINSLLHFFFSTRLTGFLLILFALSMATATFIENDYGTETSKALIYGAKWFEIVIVLLGVNFMGNIAKYNLVSWEKAPLLLFHLAFIIIIIGAGITKYRGFEALVTIKEKESTNRILSIDSFLQLQAGNKKLTKNFSPKPLLMSQLGFNRINETYYFDEKKINIHLKEYIPRAAYVLNEAKNGTDYLHLVIADEAQRKDFYLKKGTRKNFYGIDVAFNTKEKFKNEIYIKETDSVYLVAFPKTTNYFSMLENKSSFYPKDSLVPLKFRALSEIDKVPIVFKAVEKNKIRQLIQNEIDPKVKNPESAIVLEVSSGNEKKELTLFGGKGYMNPNSTLFINDIHLKLRYGSRPIYLPFSVKLKDFTLERYPGSDSPSAFYSDLQVSSKTDTLDYQIFMNNVLDYEGYRFFQSAYLPDESGTILSVNHDKWGTMVTYIGYALLALGMICSLLWNSKLFAFIPKTKLS